MNTKLLFEAIKKFIPIKEAEFDLFLSHLKPQNLKKNEVWEHPGVISRNMGFVNKGILRQYGIKDGNEFTSAFFMEGDFIGNYISYQNQRPSILITEAIEGCELLTIPFEKFEALQEIIPNTQKVSKLVGDQKLFDMQERNTSLLMNSPEERYKKILEERPELLQRVPQYQIAQYLGIRPESLSRIRKRFLS